MPAQDFTPHFPPRISWSRLLELKRVWGVSLAALLFRARTLGIVSDTAYRRSIMTMSQRGWRQQEPGDLGRAESPTALSRALELLTPSGYDEVVLANEVNLPLEMVRLIVGNDVRPKVVVGG
jgi:Zn-dependent peptidase ImmA (M78 family)